MKKVLAVGFMWPYHKGGSGRITGLVKYLPEFGWQPVILTAPLTAKPELGCEIIEAPYRLPLDFWMRLFKFKPDESVKRQLDSRLGIESKNSLKSHAVNFILTRLKEIVYYPDSERSWKPFAIKAGSELLQKGDIQAIISTSPPVTSNLIAKELKDSYKIPWVADFPHLWSQDHVYPYSSLRRLADRRLELKTLSRADALITMSESLVAKLRMLHKGKPVYGITHGFDPDTVNDPPAKLTDKFTITYTGSFAPLIREPVMLFEALQNMISRGVIDKNRVEVRFFGSKESWIESEVDKYGLIGIVRQYGRAPIEVSLAKQGESQVLFSPKPQESPQQSVLHPHPMKIFEYLAARRPILATGGYKDIVDELLDETGAGVWAATVEDIEHALEKMYKEYLEKGEVVLCGDISRIDKHSHRAMAGNFAQILNNLT